jgi:hypothetical protein
MDRQRRHLKNYYEMKLREHREEIDVLKAEITMLSNMLWEIKQEMRKDKFEREAV